MKNALFTLVLGVLSLALVGCADPTSAKNGSTTTTADVKGTPFTDRVGDDVPDFKWASSIADSGKNSLTVSGKAGAKFRYRQSDTKTDADYPSLSSTDISTMVTFSEGNLSKTINVVKRYLLVSYLPPNSGNAFFGNENLILCYYENEAWIPSSTKLVVVFAQSGTSLTISATDGTNPVASAPIRYTIDGTEPTSSSTLYSTAIPLTTSIAKVKAKAFAVTGYSDSDVKEYLNGGTNPVTGQKKLKVPLTLVGKEIQITYSDGGKWTRKMGNTVAADGKLDLAISFDATTGSEEFSASVVNPTGPWKTLNLKDGISARTYFAAGQKGTTITGVDKIGDGAGVSGDSITVELY